MIYFEKFIPKCIWIILFSVATVDKTIRISYDLLILISKNEYLKIKID